jgi:hypothetical protein
MLAKEEINIALYVYKSTNMLEENKYLKNLRNKKFWTVFRSMNLIRHGSDLSERQLYRRYYSRIFVPLDHAKLLEIYMTITQN